MQRSSNFSQQLASSVHILLDWTGRQNGADGSFQPPQQQPLGLHHHLQRIRPCTEPASCLKVHAESMPSTVKSNARLYFHPTLCAICVLKPDIKLQPVVIQTLNLVYTWMKKISDCRSFNNHGAMVGSPAE